MGRKPKQKEEQAFLAYLRSGKDEMNLLEHSLSSASKNVDKKTRSLEFSKEAIDPDTNEPVTRTWKVTFSAEYGRPTPKDDDVFVALMRVSKETEFATNQVAFTSYQLLQILGWGDDGRSYKAIDDALNRLCGVRIVATNYWYDNDAKLWVDRKFGIIDDVFLYERAKYDKAKRKAKQEGEPSPQSWIRWSDVMQESFAAGYVRTLDIEFYRSLKNPISRKLYRYLGKQFWNTSKHRIDVQQLCHEKLGYPEYDNNTCKVKLKKPLAELEEKGAYGLKYRFIQRYGNCRVEFIKSERAAAKKKASAHPLVDKLVEIGVSRNDAESAVKRLSPERIVEDIEDSAFRERKGQVKTTRAGVLYKMLQGAEPWGRPEGFVSSVERKRREEQAAKRKLAEQKKRAAEEARQQEESERETAAFIEFMSSLGSDEARAEFQEQALRENSFIASMYRKAKKKGDDVSASTHLELALRSHWKNLISEKSAANVR